ncbi:hypothetical protein [Paenibacillus flagellatus]|nr:hypothetical protein [Paenibacillus flagellatus]
MPYPIDSRRKAVPGRIRGSSSHGTNIVYKEAVHPETKAKVK